MKWYEPQPAHLMYVYDGGWQVMKYVSSTVFSRTSTAARNWYKNAEDWTEKAGDEDGFLLTYWYWMASRGFYLAGFSQYLSAMVLVTIFVALQFALLIVEIAATSIMIVLLKTGNFLYGHYHKIFFRCPDCHEQMAIPTYVCPTCATEHTRLWPSVYGVFRHRCRKCNTKLPTMDLLGRRNLIQKCAVCKRPMNKDVGRLINVHIPVIGGPTTGKSNYIFAATKQFIEDYAPPRSYTVEFPDSKHREIYENNTKMLLSGRELIKTPDIIPQAYNLSVKKSGKGIGKIVYIYDAAGEAYANEDDAILQTYYKYVHGLIFIIDPFSIDFYRQKHEDEIKPLQRSLRPSSLDVMDAYERMLTVLESSVEFQRSKKFKHPIAIIISKTDALGLENDIGQSAAQELMRKEPSILLVEDAISLLVEQFLINNQLGNFVRDLHLQFENIKFFSSSALGRMPDKDNHKPYESVRVLSPLLWILGQIDVVDVKRERIHKVDTKHKSMSRIQGNIIKSAKFYYWDSLKPKRK